MKKLIIFVLMCALTISLCACDVKTTTYPKGEKTFLHDEFTLVKKVNGPGLGVLNYIYDNNTKIVYLFTKYDHGATMCPYYTIVDGKPELAIYGVNWTE